ncbi:MAG: hypothetical protein LAT75_02720 [Candidatus Cyclonatronum sp.]|uniref:tetratricopeptide repeat protein n=1 Tax=Cyclonatronum sp. TaxID=3024185 RepID=UPI0025BB0C1F|nr:hypothetical protein [Cyclonatronum sp.]MCC5933075.1 hypothetical protein [Balneolales bacterium]MCH8485749.1 hypothetical protein [Cyclonatronum sp.]
MYRWYLLFFLIAIAGLSVIIAFDMRSKDQQQQETGQSTVHHGEGFGQTSETYFEFHGDVDVSNPEAIAARVAQIEQRLSEIEPLSRSAVPFYGELMLLHQRVGRLDGAAQASRHIAMIVNDPQDWWNAAMLNYNWAETISDTDLRNHFLSLAQDCFEEALALTQNAELLTDYAVALVSMNRDDYALSKLEAAITNHEPYYRAFLAMGMILYHHDRIDESISYLSRSIEIAETEDEIKQVRSAIAETTLNI